MGDVVLETTIQIEQAYSPEHVGPIGLDVIDGISNNSAKLLTLLALCTLPDADDASVSTTELSYLLNELQGSRPGWDFSYGKTTPLAYCSKSLVPAGLAEFVRKPGMRSKEVDGVRATPEGRTAGAAIAGALLPLEIEYRHLSLQKIYGKVSPAQLGPEGYRRIRCYQELADADGSAVSQAALHAASGYPRDVIPMVLGEMERHGIIEGNRRLGPSERVFDFTAEPPAQFNYKMGTETKAALAAILGMREDGMYEASGAEIVKAALRDNPELDPHRIWQRFNHWVTQNRYSGGGFVKEIVGTNGIIHRKHFSLTDIYEGLVKQLLSVRTQLAGNSQEDEQFRQKSMREAYELIYRRRDVKMLFTKSKLFSSYVNLPDADEWHTAIDRYVSTDQINITVLRQQAMHWLGKNISPRVFRNLVNSNPDLIISDEKHWKDTRPVGYVRVQKISFTKDWQKDGICTQPSIDQEMFFPEKDDPSLTQKTEAAKAICGQCAVRRACLKTAVENKYDFGIWGGKTTEERKAMTLQQIDTVKDTVQIGSATV